MRFLFSCDCVCTVAVIDSAVGETGKHAVLGFQDNFPFGDNKRLLCDLLKLWGHERRNQTKITKATKEEV